MNSNEIRERLLRDESVREKIHRRAYEIYVERGGGDGRAYQDWLQAEDEILAPLVEAEMQRLAATALEEPAPTKRAKTGSARTTKKPATVTKEASAPKKAASSKTTASKTSKSTRSTKSKQA